jgi:hypothetical protein
MFLGLLFSAAATSGVGASLPTECSTNCDTPFGTELGRDSSGVTAYSNCNDDCVSNLDNYVSQPHIKVRHVNSILFFASAVDQKNARDRIASSFYMLMHR